MLLGRGHHASRVDAGEYHSDETGSPLISHLHYRQIGVVLSLRRKQQGTGKADLQGSSELAFVF